MLCQNNVYILQINVFTFVNIISVTAITAILSIIIIDLKLSYCLLTIN